MNETDLASMIIRNQIDAYDLALEKIEQEKFQAVPLVNEDLECEQAPVTEFVRVTLGSKRPTMTLASLEERHTTDLAFQNVRTKINRALSHILGTAQRISVTAEQEVSMMAIIQNRYINF